MKIIINKANSAIRITAPEITDEELDNLVYWVCGVAELCSNFSRKIEEEPKKVNCPFDKGDCRYCTVQFCGAREENHIETRSTAEPVDLEREIEKAQEHYFALKDKGFSLDSIDVSVLATHFYELGRKGGSK